MKNKILKLIIVSFISAVISQIGSLVISLGDSVMRSPTIASFALTCIVAFAFETIIMLMYELIFPRYTSLTEGITIFFILFFFGITAKYLFNPVEVSGGIAYRYPCLAPIFAIELLGEVITLHKTKQKMNKLKVSISVENIFLVIALITGITLCIAIYPKTMSCWDDGTHFEQSLYCSEGMYSVASNAEIKEIFMECPETIEGLNALDSEYFVLTNAEAFFPERITHFIFAIGMWAGRLVNANFSTVFKMGKISNLLMYVVITYFAIKRLKTGKILLATISLTPGIIFLACSYSADGWLMAFCSLAFAYYVGAIQRENEVLQQKEIVIMILGVLLASLPKPPYAFLLITFIFMPKEKFANKKQRIAFIAAIFVGIIAALAMAYIQGMAVGGIEDKRASGNINGAMQIAYIIENIPSVFIMIVKFVSNWMNPMNCTYLTDLGIEYFWENYRYFYLAIIVATLIKNNTKANIGIRIWTFVVCFAMLSIVVGVFYLYFTPVGSTGISGVQSRYIYPVLYPIFAITFAGLIPQKKK